MLGIPITILFHNIALEFRSAMSDGVTKLAGMMTCCFSGFIRDLDDKHPNWLLMFML